MGRLIPGRVRRLVRPMLLAADVLEAWRQLSVVAPRTPFGRRPILIVAPHPDGDAGLWRHHRRLRGGRARGACRRADRRRGVASEIVVIPAIAPRRAARGGGEGDMTMAAGAAQ